MCICAYPKEILIKKNFWEKCPYFELRNLTIIKDSTVLKTVHQLNSAETSQENFLKLYSYEGHTMWRYALLQEMLI